MPNCRRGALATSRRLAVAPHWSRLQHTEAPKLLRSSSLDSEEVLRNLLVSVLVHSHRSASPCPCGVSHTKKKISGNTKLTASAPAQQGQQQRFFIYTATFNRPLDVAVDAGAHCFCSLFSNCILPPQLPTTATTTLCSGWLNSAGCQPSARQQHSQYDSMNTSHAVANVLASHTPSLVC